MITTNELPSTGAGSFRKTNPVSASVATKLVRDTRYGSLTRRHNYNKPQTPNMENLYGVSERTAANINDIENIFEVLPETERCEMIITSCILSPDDMKSIDLRYVAESSEVPSVVLNAMKDVLEEHFTKVYKIKDLLPKIIRDGLFKTGSYPVMFIPESSLDYLINEDNGRLGMEAHRDVINSTLAPLGVLGDNDAVSASTQRTRATGIEGLFSGSTSGGMTNQTVQHGLSVTDNPAILRMPHLQEKATLSRLANAYSRVNATLYRPSTESFDERTMTLNDVARKLYVKRRHRTEQVVKIHTQEETKRNSVGHPLIMKLPSDSVIPVHTPSNPSEHIGYFVLLDDFGNPLSLTSDSVYHQELEQRYQSSRNEAGNVLEDVKKSMYGKCDCDIKSAAEMLGAYTEFVERDLLQRFRNGCYSGRQVNIARPNEVYRLMFARTLANKHTQLLYVPTELLTYFAFDYNRRGIGRSLTDRSKILASIRALLLFASTQAAVRAAVGHKEMKLTLDPDDPDPDKTIEMAVHEYIRVNNGNYPLGITDPNDIFSYLGQAGISVTTEGHPGYPDVKAEMVSIPSAISQIDQELERDLRNRHIATYGIAPEVVDGTTGVDFAATIRTSNVFFDKQITIWKDSLCNQVSEHIRKLVVNSGALLGELFDVVNEHASQIPADFKVRDWQNEIVIAFLEGFRVELPDATSTKLETQLQKLTTFVQTLDVVMTHFASPQILMAMDPDMDQTACEATIEIMKSQFVRDFIIQQSIMPEVSDLLTWPGDEDSPAYSFMTAQTGYVEALGNTLREMMATVKTRRAAEREKAGTDGAGGQVSGDYNNSPEPSSYDNPEQTQQTTDDEFQEEPLDGTNNQPELDDQKVENPNSQDGLPSLG